MPELTYATRIPAPAEAVFRYHEREGALDRLLPPWQRVRVLERHGKGIEPGARVVLELRQGPLHLRWEAVHGVREPPRRFTDDAVRGPFARWHHEHEVEAAEDGASVLRDRVAYDLPVPFLGNALGGPFARASLLRMFRWRHERTANDLARHATEGTSGAGGTGGAAAATPLRVGVTGASGLVGSDLCAFLTTGGHPVRRFVRRDPRPGAAEARWSVRDRRVDPGAFDGLDAVVHLAGENVGAGRWTPARKRRIRESRTEGTRLVAETLAGLDDPPRTLVAASATGYYGDRGDEPLTEESPPGEGFLADVCQAWEEPTEAAREAGVRVVNLRTGIVLSPKGGALARLLRPFRLGAGGPVGGGNQWMSWIALDDFVGAIHHLLRADAVQGPVNLVAPNPVTNRDFARTLGRVLRRPAVAPLPAFAVKLALGELGQALLLDGQRVQPRKLEASGFRFLHPDLEGALRFELGLLGGRAP